MVKEKILALLNEVREGSVSPEEALASLKRFPFEDLDHTKLDHHRHLRKGIQEIVFGEGKSLSQIMDIVASMRASQLDVLVTRLDRETGEALAAAYPEGVYDTVSRCFVVKTDSTVVGKGMVLIISAGTSDTPVAQEAYVTSTFLGNRTEKLYDLGVAGIHRLFHFMDKLQEAHVIIVVAGMEGALPSIVGGIVRVPVIAVPTSIGYGASFGGLSALLSMLNSCSTVAVFNIDNGFGAAYYATLINRL